MQNEAIKAKMACCAMDPRKNMAKSITCRII